MPLNTHTLKVLEEEARKAIAQAQDESSLLAVEKRYLGRKGQVSSVLREIKNLSQTERRSIGQQANTLRRELERLIQSRQRTLKKEPSGTVDLTLPGEQPERGHLHPVTTFTRHMFDAWRALSFDFHEGPELESDWYNFEALNIPPEHPARDIHDTFFIKGRPDLVLRTHISTVQLRALKHRKPPLRFVEIGSVYRHEATDATHESMFTECEGLVIGEQLTMAHLVSTLKAFFTLLFRRPVVIRVRPSYFPFVEPGIEMDMQWTVQGKTRWLEILGAGMIHPHVLKSMKLDRKQWNGFAFGMGVDRLMMLHYDIPDVRLSYSGNLHFLRQF